MKFLFTLFFILFLFAFQFQSKAALNFYKTGKDTLTPININKARLNGLVAGFVAGYGGGLILLDKAWYSKETQISFHFYDDADHWKQIDKAGHFWSSFHQSRIGVDALKWTGLNNKKSILIGGMMGVVLQTPIEIFDGFSSDYGASWSDFGANATGSVVLIAQYLAWEEIRIMPKFSFHTTAYASMRPNTFGKSLGEQVLKDYNGQSYWLSFDVSSFLSLDSKYPKWLNIAAGYGATDMLYGNPDHNRTLDYTPYRRFFLSPDINLQNIKTKSKFLKKAFYILSAFRIPMPAIEFNSQKQLKFHPLYF